MAADIASKRFSIPLCTKQSRSSRRSTFSPTTWNRKCPGSMMPAWTGPTGISCTPSPSTRTNAYSSCPGCHFGERLEVAPQRELVDRPARLPYPRPLVVAFGGEAEEIERRALHPVRRREHDREVGIRGIAGRQRELEHHEPLGVLHDRVDRVAALAIAVVAAPERHEARALFPGDAARGEEPHRIHRTAARRHGGMQHGGGESEAGEIHVRPVLVRARPPEAHYAPPRGAANEVSVGAVHSSR